MHGADDLAAQERGPRCVGGPILLCRSRRNGMGFSARDWDIVIQAPLFKAMGPTITRAMLGDRAPKTYARGEQIFEQSRERAEDALDRHSPMPPGLTGKVPLAPTLAGRPLSWLKGGRYAELQELLATRRMKSWSSHRFGAEALVRQGSWEAAIAFAEAGPSSTNPGFSVPWARNFRAYAGRFDHGLRRCGGWRPHGTRTATIRFRLAGRADPRA